jgi:hypothetical protein
MPNELIPVDASDERLRLLVESGAVSASDIVAWADKKIALDPSPPMALIELSISPLAAIGDVLAARTSLPSPEEGLPIIASLWYSGVLSVDASWMAILKLIGARLHELPGASPIWDVYMVWDTGEDFPGLPQQAKELLQQILTSHAAQAA